MAESKPTSDPDQSDSFWGEQRRSLNDPNRGKATPRPWRADGTRVRCAVEGHYRGPDIAQCDLTHGLGEAHDTDLANARLIVTAVNAHADLLAACEAALAYDAAIMRRGFMGAVEARPSGEHYAVGDDLDALYHDWIAKAQTAIAKAEAGRPSPHTETPA